VTDELNVDIFPKYPVSWQTTVLNGLLRGTMKPVTAVLVRNTPGMVVARELLGLSEHLSRFLPGHVSIVPDEIGGCRAEWVRGAADLDEDKVVLYFHGGAYFVCSPATHRPITWRLSAAARRPVLSLDYRQGPSHTLTESLADALAAYQGLLDAGHRPKDIVIAGDSAGGHLTLATLLALRDEGMPLPAAGICLSPWADLTVPPRRENRWADPMLPASRIDWLARRWTDGRDPRDPLISPVYGDYTGVPPLMIVTGSTEILRGEARRVADRARRSGVPVRYEEWHRMPHVFPIFSDVLPEARRIFEHIERFLGAVEKFLAASGAEAA